MATNVEFHQLIERLLDHDEPLKEGEMENFRTKLGEQVANSQRQLRIAALVVLAGIPTVIVGQALALGASRQPPTFPALLGYLGMFLAVCGMIVVPMAAIWLLLFYVPRYLRARRDLRDSMLAFLVRRVDELSTRVDAIAPRK